MLALDEDPEAATERSVSIAPHSGVGARAPRPRKESAATSRMAVARVRVACTIRGAMMFGSTPEMTIWASPAPQVPLGLDVVPLADGDDR